MVDALHIHLLHFKADFIAQVLIINHLEQEKQKEGKQGRGFSVTYNIKIRFCRNLLSAQSQMVKGNGIL